MPRADLDPKNMVFGKESLWHPSDIASLFLFMSDRAIKSNFLAEWVPVMMVWMDWVNLWKDWGKGSASKWERLGASRVLGGSCSGKEQDEPYDGYDEIFERNLSENGDGRGGESRTSRGGQAVWR